MSKAQATRLSILQQAFGLIYTHGYQATSVDDIIATTKVTKGAFYYHFKNKDEMGIAIIEEILRPTMEQAFIGKIKDSADPVKDIYAMIKYLLLDEPNMQVQYGCPAGNLTQEMTPWNTEFSTALLALVAQWQHMIEGCINNGKKGGNIRRNVNAQQVALFVMSGYWGIRNFGKLYNSKDCYHVYLKELKLYLKGLQ